MERRPAKSFHRKAIELGRKCPVVAAGRGQLGMETAARANAIALGARDPGAGDRHRFAADLGDLEDLLQRQRTRGKLRRQRLSLSNTRRHHHNSEPESATSTKRRGGTHISFIILGGGNSYGGRTRKPVEYDTAPLISACSASDSALHCLGHGGVVAANGPWLPEGRYAPHRRLRLKPGHVLGDQVERA